MISLNIASFLKKMVQLKNSVPWIHGFSKWIWIHTAQAKLLCFAAKARNRSSCFPLDVARTHWPFYKNALTSKGTNNPGQSLHSSAGSRPQLDPMKSKELVDLNERLALIFNWMWEWYLLEDLDFGDGVFWGVCEEWNDYWGVLVSRNFRG
jgi:hypothetical protein